MSEEHRVFERDRDGKTTQRIAYTPADAVKFTFDGWTEVTGAAATKVVAAADKAAAAAEKEAAAADKAAAAAAKK